MRVRSKCFANLGLAGQVGLKIRQHQEGIVVQQVVDQGPEDFAVAAGKATVGDQVQDRLQFRVGGIEFVGRVTGLQARLHLPGGQAKQKKVLRPEALADLDVGSV